MRHPYTAMVAALLLAAFSVMLPSSGAIAQDVASPALPMPESPPLPGALSVLTAAKALELDMSASEARAVLLARRLDIEIETDLPPDGLTRLFVAVPQDDDCIPRGAPFACPAIRVFLLNDPQRGHRVVRVEAYETVAARLSVAQVFQHVAASMGPPMQTEMWPEQIRGGAVVVWRQRWREGFSDGPLTEILVTQDAPLRPGLGLADPNAPATGVGYVVADTEAEGAFASVRRRLRTP